MYDLISTPLQFFYELVPNYAVAISLLTLTIMVILLPLTLKGTRSMIAMQKLQPELRKIQAKHRDDRQKLNEEMMAFYRENNINPVSGCLPLLLQMPVFFILYNTLYQLINRAPYGEDMGAAVARHTSGAEGGVFDRFGYFVPNHIDHGSKLFEDLNSTREMRSFGINLADSANAAFGHGLTTWLPYVVLVLIVMGTSYYQQRQIAGRNKDAPVNPQQQMLMRIMPVFFAFISYTLPAFIVVYFLVSNVFRIGQQAFITRTLYRDTDGPVSTTGKAVDKASTKGGSKDGEKAKPKGLLAGLRELEAPNPQKAKAEVRAAKGSATEKKAPSSAAHQRKPNAGPSRQAPSSANRSRSKKKRK